jgi:dihydrofolate synthase/folylpolyglutamate synthase
VPIAGSESHVAQAFGSASRGYASVAEALRGIPADGMPILIAGSLYLAGEVLRLNEEIPD